MSPIKIYIAASWTNRFRLREIRDQFAKMGIEITSQWIDFDRGYGDGDFSEEAFRDYEDITNSHILIIDTTDKETRGGREWEGGYATGIGRSVYRVGPVITPFHEAVEESFNSWEDCLEYFRHNSD